MFWQLLPAHKMAISSQMQRDKKDLFDWSFVFLKSLIILYSFFWIRMETQKSSYRG